MPLELYTLTAALYTQRIHTYLTEKHLLHSPSLKITPCTQTALKLSALGKPPGTVPILSLGKGTYIKQSLAILEYFEDICDEAAKTGNKTGLFENAGGGMRGTTMEERARVREVVGLACEATEAFGVAAHKVRFPFLSLSPQTSNE
jgi:glutathione S-transferase